MPETIRLILNQRYVQVPEGATVAVAILLAGSTFRRSIHGEPRGALCGMGTCFECRAMVNGRAQQRTCQLLCQPGMIVATDE
ncbi:(2Fe-2S)-binding protein [Granulicella arctica]|uniref:(2Fe-2S)-binding protein n=1 Tax=Granulicella arctica TaxID=940613 RepID=UPI0021DFA247|nr:(2Fe-2S)-binding protein [Granulicella arctica]